MSMEVDTVIGPNRLVHLDLKRAPIKVEYLEKLFPLFKLWGATGILIEWEDSFPYSGKIACIGSLNSCTKAYSDAEVDKIHHLAAHNNMEVVPLVQTFGHLEFVLKHENWRELREVSLYPNSLCPSNPEALTLVTSMVDQVIAKSPKTLRYFHIGADEVWQLGACSNCSDQDRHLVLLTHLTAVLRHIQYHYPFIRPIMWEDMLRNIDLQLLKEFALGELVDPMVWIYDPAPSFFISGELWNKYKAIFNNIWVASAFKGATGSSQILPIIRDHISNHEMWLAHLSMNTDSVISGIAITGWSRYDHYAALCELLPAALPSLCICLKVWLSGSMDDSVLREVSTSLGYTKNLLPLLPFPRPQPVEELLSFPGWRIFTGVEWLANLRTKHQSLVSSQQVITWLSPWHIKNNFTNPLHIQGLISPLFELCREWEALEIYMTKHLTEAYYDSTVDEWLYVNVHGSKQAAKQLHVTAEKQLAGGSQWSKKNEISCDLFGPFKDLMKSKEICEESEGLEDFNEKIDAV